MADRNSSQRPESDLLRHTAKLKAMLQEVADHAREDVGKVSEPQAKAIFEMTAEIIGGIQKTLTDYEQKQEAAFAPRGQ